MAKKTYKGILLAGGTNSRLYPTTLVVPKVLLPIYDKPLLYYSLALHMQAGIREVLIITSAMGKNPIQKLVGDGSQWGMKISFAVQKKPKGIAEALLIARDVDFLKSKDYCMLVLGDNILHGKDIPKLFAKAKAHTKGATIFSYPVKDPKRFGIVETDKKGIAISLEEKPTKPKSNKAVVGVYFF